LYGEDFARVAALDHTQSVHLYRIAQEAINNAIRHGQADRVEVHLDVEDSSVVMQIRDNGTGLATTRKSKPGLGLRIMRHRAGALGANSRSNPSVIAAAQTTVRCRIPLNVFPAASPIDPNRSLCLPARH